VVSKLSNGLVVPFSVGTVSVELVEAFGTPVLYVAFGDDVALVSVELSFGRALVVGIVVTTVEPSFDDAPGGFVPYPAEELVEFTVFGTDVELLEF